MVSNIDVKNKYGDYLGDLLDGTVFISEFHRSQLRFFLKTSKSFHDYELKIGGISLQRINNFFVLDIYDQMIRGRRGELNIRVFYKDEHVLTGTIFIVDGNLNISQYRFLVEDLARIINLSSQDDSAVQSDRADFERQFVEILDKRLEVVEGYLKKLGFILNELSHSPWRATLKEYFLERQGRKSKIDSKTIQLNAKLRGRMENRVMSYRNKEGYDLHENQFLVYALKRIRHFVFFLQKEYVNELQRKRKELHHQLIDYENFVVIDGSDSEIKQREVFKATQINALNKLISEVENHIVTRMPIYQERIGAIFNKIDYYLSETFLSDVSLKKDFIVLPTLRLLLDPIYNKAYKDYLSLQKKLKIDEQEEIERLLVRTPAERTSTLYEYWVFLQVFLELRRMGFYVLDGDEGVLSIIRKDVLKFIPGKELVLQGDPRLYTYGNKTIRAKIYYEKTVEYNGRSHLPDVFVEFELKSTKVLIIDAKYKNYDQIKEGAYLDDLTKAALYKNSMVAINRKDADSNKEKVAAAFIIHSHNDDARFLDYGSGGHSNEYGAVPLIPDEQDFNSKSLKTMLKMFMRMHLRIFDVCWSDAHEKPVKAERITFNRNRKGQYHCPVCDNRWWVNHCGHCGEEVLKITFSDPSDNYFEVDEELMMGERKVLKCSTCNQGFVAGKTKRIIRGST